MDGERENNGERKWVAVRLPRDLKYEIEIFIKKHPELGYNGLTDFVRDSVRRRFEYLMEQEITRKSRIDEIEREIRIMLTSIVGEEEGIRFDREVMTVKKSISPDDPAEFIRAISGILQEIIGPRAARTITESVYMRRGEEDV